MFSGRNLEVRRLPLTPLNSGGKEKEKMSTDEAEVWRQGNEDEFLDGNPCSSASDDGCGDLRRTGSDPLVIRGGYPFSIA